jgi:predicted amidohydrolase
MDKNDRLIVAAVQMNSQEYTTINVKQAISLLEDAAEAGAKLVVLPENFNYLGPESGLYEAAEPIPGPTISAIADIAHRQNITILAGSMIEKDTDSQRYFNTSVLIDSSGQIIAKYRKIHLFDAEIGDAVSEKESKFFSPGEEIVTATVYGHRAGLSICYDLRFPELYRSLVDRDSEIIFVPAAFTMFTGKDHWELLLRTRAIENQCFVVAANQCGRHNGGWCYGRSMIVDPWGIVIASAPDNVGVVLAELDFSALERIRHQLPALLNRRLFESQV